MNLDGWQGRGSLQSPPSSTPDCRCEMDPENMFKRAGVFFISTINVAYLYLSLCGEEEKHLYYEVIACPFHCSHRLLGDTIPTRSFLIPSPLFCQYVPLNPIQSHVVLTFPQVLVCHDYLCNRIPSLSTRFLKDQINSIQFTYQISNKFMNMYLFRCVKDTSNIVSIELDPLLMQIERLQVIQNDVRL